MSNTATPVTTIEGIKAIVGDLPNMTTNQAEILARHIRDTGAKNLLELGFCFGVSTCYLASVLESRGGEGHIATIDLKGAANKSPNITQLLAQAGLSHRVTTYFEPTSYTWRMMRMLEENPDPRFDFCYLDGAHSWFVDGFAFFLIDRLLRPGGWIVFDDINWSYATSLTMKDMEITRKMPDDERELPHVRKIFELLVAPHPNYTDLSIDGDWGWARKRGDGEVLSARSNVVIEKEQSVARVLKRKLLGGR